MNLELRNLPTSMFRFGFDFLSLICFLDLDATGCEEASNKVLQQKEMTKLNQERIWLLGFSKNKVKHVQTIF